MTESLYLGVRKLFQVEVTGIRTLTPWTINLNLWNLGMNSGPAVLLDSDTWTIKYS